jgi:hypothetical protein
VGAKRRTGNLWDGELGSCKIQEHVHRMRLRIIFHVVFAFLENSNYIQVHSLKSHRLKKENVYFTIVSTRDEGFNLSVLNIVLKNWLISVL